MKKIKLFSGAVALTLMASCASEEIQPTSPVAPSEERPTTDFVFSVDDAVFESTRAYFANQGEGFKWHFNVGDKIGAMLMDEWNGRGEGIENFTITDYAQSNIPVTKSEDGRWYVHEDVNPLAGNYFFYFPFEPVTTARGHFGFSVNPIQPQFNKEGKFDYWAAVEANQRYMGYSFAPVKEYDGQKINLGALDFAPYFAMPAFEFLNKAGDLIIDKVVIRGAESLDASMYDKEQNKLIATTMALVPGDAGFNDHKNEWKNNDGDITNETNLLWKYAMKYTSGGHLDEIFELPKNQGKSWTPGTKPFYALSKTFVDTYTDQAPAYEYVADYTGVEGGHIVKQFDYIRAILVMPAGDYNVDGFEAMIHVRPVGNPEDRYVVRIPLDLVADGQFDDNQQTAGHKSLEPGKTSKFYGAFDATAMKSFDLTKGQITSSEDLLWMVEEANKNTGDYKLRVNTTGKRVVLTKEIEEILTAKPNIQLHINGKITLAENTSENAINLLYYNDDNVATDLTILNKQVAKKTISNLAKLTVESGAELVAGTISAWNGSANPKNYTKVINKGKIECTYLSACSVENKGTIDVKKLDKVEESANQMFIQGSVTNDGTINVATALRLANNQAKVTNNGDLTAGNIKNNAAFPTYVVNVENNKTLKVEGVLYTNLTNNKGEATVGTIWNEADNKKDATLNINKSVKTLMNAGTTNIKGAIGAAATNSGTINVEGATSVYNVTNTGTINVNAALTENATLINNGTVNVAAGAEILAPGQGKVNNAGTINVEGKLKENVYSKGLINVIGEGIVIAKDILDETAGIIDVTKANNTNAAHAAKSNSDDMYFRYTVNVTTGDKLDKEQLFPRISAQNYTVNPVILVWDATSPANYQGGTKVMTDVNVTDVIINRELLLDGNTGFEDAVNVEINKEVTVGNGTKDAGFNCGSAIVTINSIIKVNNHGKLTGSAKYTGAGIIELLGANAKMEWTPGTGWTGKVNK